jgi:Plasmid maintenance system antidote protein
MAKAKSDKKPTGIFIEELMEIKRLKKKDLAERMETTDATVSRLLTGERGLDLDWFHRIAKALEVPLWQLFQPPTPENPKSPEAALRSALLAYGVDQEELPQVFKAIKGFVSDVGDEQSQSGRPHDQSEPASRPHASTPSE